MFQKLLKVTFYSIRKLQHLQPPTALPTWTGLDRTGPDRWLPARRSGPGRPAPAGPVHGSISCELRPNSQGARLLLFTRINPPKSRTLSLSTLHEDDTQKTDKHFWKTNLITSLD